MSNEVELWSNSMHESVTAELEEGWLYLFTKRSAGSEIVDSIPIPSAAIHALVRFLLPEGSEVVDRSEIDALREVAEAAKRWRFVARTNADQGAEQKQLGVALDQLRAARKERG